jgi:hypothetical protein
MRPYLEKNCYKNRAGGVAQGEGPEFKPQCHKNKKTKPLNLALHVDRMFKRNL